MPLLKTIEEYLIDLENTNKTPEHFVQRTRRIVYEINSANQDELKETLIFLADFKKTLQITPRTASLDFRMLGKNMLVGGSIGLGIGFFAGVSSGGLMIGALCGLEKAGLSIYFRRIRLDQIAEDLLGQITIKMEGFAKNPCLQAS